MSFAAGATKEEMALAAGYHNAVANLLFQGTSAEKWPWLSTAGTWSRTASTRMTAPMDFDWIGDPSWDAFSKYIGGWGSHIDQVARGSRQGRSDPEPDC